MDWMAGSAFGWVKAADDDDGVVVVVMMVLLMELIVETPNCW